MSRGGSSRSDDHGGLSQQVRLDSSAVSESCFHFPRPPPDLTNVEEISKSQSLTPRNLPCSPELVERKVKGLLNRLTVETFDPISDQIITWANKSETEKNSRTLIQVIRLVFEQAMNEATSEICARLCRKMMEKISNNVQDDDIKDDKGKPITGGQLFRKYLLSRCQEDFEGGRVVEKATADTPTVKSLEDEAARAANTKARYLGLIKFMGELFKMSMLTERIMHKCIKQLLANRDSNPEERDMEGLCKLLDNVGSVLDTPKARGHVDAYFSRMKEFTRNPNVTPRLQYALQDILELRERRWIRGPTMMAQAQGKKPTQQRTSIPRGGSRRGGDRTEFAQHIVPGSCAVTWSGSAPHPPPKSGGLLSFRRKSNAQTSTLRPNSAFFRTKGPESKQEAISILSTGSSQGTETSIMDNTATGPSPQRKRLVLQPRSVPVGTISPTAEFKSNRSEEAGIEMSEEAALKKIGKDLEEFFAVRNLEEFEVYFRNIPSQHHHLLVNKIVSTAIESKEDDAKLVAQFFALAATNKLCSAASFEQGILPTAEVVDDIAIDAPKAFQLLAMMVKGADLEHGRISNLASKLLDSDKFLALLQQ